MTKRRMFGAAFATLILPLLALTIWVAPANAGAATTPAAICPSWSLRSIVGTQWQDPADGSTVSGENTVVLTKPDGGGTEFAAFDVDHLAESADITVQYELGGGASSTAGAVRLFYYATQDADTLSAAPDGVAVADADAGTLTIAGVSGPVGTLGLVYDASNTAAGAVTFTDLKVGGVKVRFKDVCTPDTSPSPSPSVSTSASPEPSASASPPAPGAGGGDEEPSLPVTGVSVPLLVSGAVALLAVGGVLFAVTRKRRIRTVA